MHNHRFAHFYLETKFKVDTTSWDVEIKQGKETTERKKPYIFNDWLI